MHYSRRDFGKVALAAVPLASAFGAKIDSKYQGVRIGAITYSFNRIAMPDPTAIINAYVEIGLGEAELMSNHCEALAGAPAMPMFGRFGRPPAQGPGGGTPAGGTTAGTPPAGPRPGGRPQLTPEQMAEREAAMKKVAEWRSTTSANTWKSVAKKRRYADRWTRP